MTEIRIVVTDAAVQPHGHYSQAVVHNGTVYVSGVLGNTHASQADGQRSTVDQASHCLDQLEIVLSAAGSGLDLVLKMGIFVSAIEDWPTVNTLCAARFGNHRPARIVVPSKPMRLGSTIEIDAIAAVRSHEAGAGRLT